MGGGLMQSLLMVHKTFILQVILKITSLRWYIAEHTNFSMEAIEQIWNGTSTNNGRCTATISRNGDLVHRMYIEVQGKVKDTGGDDWKGLEPNPGVGWIKILNLKLEGKKLMNIVVYGWKLGQN